MFYTFITFFFNIANVMGHNNYKSFNNRFTLSVFSFCIISWFFTLFSKELLVLLSGNAYSPLPERIHF